MAKVLKIPKRSSVINEAINLMESDKDEEVELREELEGKITAKDYFSLLKTDIDNFDYIAWNKKAGFKAPSFPIMTEKMEGWDSGLYIFAGTANAGKTAIMLNIMEDLCMYKNNKLFGIYFSLDDSKQKVIPRIIAMRESIPITVVSKPTRYTDLITTDPENREFYETLLEKRKRGLENLKNDSNKLTIFDTTDIKNVDDMHDCIKQINNYVKALDPEMKIMVGIDSLKDIEFPSEKYGKLNTNEKVDLASKTVKDWSTELDIMIFASMHLRKLNTDKRPTTDDLKESNTLEYEANVCFLIYNDVSRNKEAAKVYYTIDKEPEKHPVIEIDWAKNKQSSFKGRSFCHFSPEYSKAAECSQEATNRYNATIMS